MKNWIKGCTIDLGRFYVNFAFIWKSRKNPSGRFGGGWQWKLGFQLGDHTLMIDILICSVVITTRIAERNT